MNILKYFSTDKFVSKRQRQHNFFRSIVIGCKQKQLRLNLIESTVTQQTIKMIRLTDNTGK